MANYNTPAPFLRRALDSVLEQTFADFEVIIVNDGSEDESRDILYEYANKDSRIIVIENGRNLGLPASLNNGLGHCSGEYIARFDTDDICLPDRLALQKEYMDANPAVMFAGAWALCFENDENEITRTLEPVMCSDAEYRIRLLFASAPLLVHPTAVFRRAFLEKNALLYPEDPAFRYCEDYKMWTSCAASGEAGILQKPVIKYRVAESDARITVRHSEQMKNCVYNVQKELFSELGLSLSKADSELVYFMLNGRKTYNIRYRQIIKDVISANSQKQIYNGALLKKMLYDRWYNIVYYAVAYEKSIPKRLKYLFTLFPSQYLRFFKEIIK